ncbi:hypothetical protein [Streptomyces sp. NPDC056600]|uniref:hypothetical protein n=1 Tax=Streptomyces sp. NPDC056600 TaxID=3345874 RepID=UPI0036825129
MAPYKNQLPDGLERELAQAEALGVRPLRVGDAGFDEAVNSGTLKRVVDENGELLVMPKTVDGIELKHPVLTRGGDVHAPGEADIAGGDGSYFRARDQQQQWSLPPSLESLRKGRL